MLIQLRHFMEVLVSAMAAVAVQFFPSMVNASVILPTHGAVSIEQIDFRGGANSGVAEFTVYREAANAVGSLSAGYINVADSNSNWLVRNLPVFDSASYDFPSITTRMDLGSPDGQDISSINLYVEYSADPVTTFSQGSMSAFSVTNVGFAAGGVGDSLLDHYLPRPDLTGVNFSLGGLVSHCHQFGHDNVQAAKNQCAPAAVANSLDWLERSQGLKVPDDHKPGLRSDAPNDGDDPTNPSLVGELERAMNRSVTSRAAGKGVWPLDGKLKYLSESDLAKRLVIKHQGSGQPGLTGANDVIRHGVTSKGMGATVTWDFICSQICQGEDVELDILFAGPLDGRHYVNAIGCGLLLGMPFVYHVSDHIQTDLDPLDKLGTNKVDFAFLAGDFAFHPLDTSWNGTIDQVIAESIPAPGTLGLLLAGVGLLFYRSHYRPRLRH